MTLRPHTKIRDGDDGDECNLYEGMTTVEEVPAVVGNSQASDSFTDEQGVAGAPPDEGVFEPTEVICVPCSDDVELDLELESSMPKVAPSPYAPSRQQRAEHNVTHCPFRSWCAHCVAGKCKSTPHSVKTGKKDQSDLPNIGVDYAFMSDKGDQAGTKIGEIKILGIEYDESKYTSAAPVPQKGIDGDEWSVRRQIQCLELFGYTRST